MRSSLRTPHRRQGALWDATPTNALLAVLDADVVLGADGAAVEMGAAPEHPARLRWLELTPPPPEV